MDIAHVTSLGSTAGTLMGSNIILDTHIPSKSLFSITLVLICITLCLVTLLGKCHFLICLLHARFELQNNNIV